jgi:hypothetical protein
MGRGVEDAPPLRQITCAEQHTGAPAHFMAQSVLFRLNVLFDSQTGWSTDFRQTLRKLPEVGMTVRIMIAPLLAQSSQTAKTEVNRTPIRALHAQSLHKHRSTSKVLFKKRSWRHHFQPYIGTRRKSATTTRENTTHHIGSSVSIVSRTWATQVRWPARIHPCLLHFQVCRCETIVSTRARWRQRRLRPVEAHTRAPTHQALPWSVMC